MELWNYFVITLSRKENLCGILRVKHSDYKRQLYYCGNVHSIGGYLTLYSPVVTICTTSVTFNNSTFCPHRVFMCFVWI